MYALLAVYYIFCKSFAIYHRTSCPRCFSPNARFHILLPLPYSAYETSEIFKIDHIANKSDYTYRTYIKVECSLKNI